MEEIEEELIAQLIEEIREDKTPEWLQEADPGQTEEEVN